MLKHCCIGAAIINYIVFLKKWVTQPDLYAGGGWAININMFSAFISDATSMSRIKKSEEARCGFEIASNW